MIVSTAVIAIATIVYAIAAIFQYQESKKTRRIAMINYFASVWDYMEQGFRNKHPKKDVTTLGGRKIHFLRKYFDKEIRELYEFSQNLQDSKESKAKSKINKE
jgi:hypothetical protein